MALKTGDDYLASIKSLKLESNILGKKTGNLSEHGMVEPSQQAVAFTFDGALPVDDYTLSAESGGDPPCIGMN